MTIFTQCGSPHMRNPRARKIIIQHNFALLKSQLGLRFQLNFSVVHALIPGNWGTIIIKEHEQHNRWAATNSPDNHHHHLGTTFVHFSKVFPLQQLVSLFKKCGSRHPVVRLYWNIYQHLNLKEMYEHVSVNTTIGNPGKTRFFSWKKKSPILSTKQNHWNLFMYVKSR